MDKILIVKIIKEIKLKSQLKYLKDEYIENKITKYFLTNGDKRKKLEKIFEDKKEKIIKNKKFKEIIKIIREEIGIVYGSYLTSDFSKKEKILNEIKNKDEVKILLKLHKSTRERTQYFSYIYEKIFLWYEKKNSNKPKIILDLACGLNPCSIFEMEKELGYIPKYFASDLNPNDMNFLNKFFKKFNINGKAKSYDIVNLKILNDKEFQESDLVFLFKALDSFEQIKKNISKELILGLKSKYIVVSFPTKSLVSKKEFKIEKRNWFFKFLDKEEFSYEIFEVENEIFILIEK